MFWNKVEKLFGNMLFNHTNASTNATSYLEIQRLGYQLVVYASDWAEFTNQSDLGNLSFLVVLTSAALDACKHIEIWDPPTGIMNESLTSKELLALFQNGSVKVMLVLLFSFWGI